MGQAARGRTQGSLRGLLWGLLGASFCATPHRPENPGHRTQNNNQRSLDPEMAKSNPRWVYRQSNHRSSRRAASFARSTSMTATQVTMQVMMPLGVTMATPAHQTGTRAGPVRNYSHRALRETV
jgi:hypothetical protein